MGKRLYAYSIKTTRVRETDFPYNGQKITCTSKLLDFARSLQEADTEKFLAIYLNAQNQIICIQITNGTVNHSVAYPRELIRHALMVGACAIILAHNHPSGALKPSPEDIQITRLTTEIAKQLGIKVHDHIIITDNGFYSFLEEGVMPK